MRVLHFVENYLPITETFVFNYICKSAEAGEVAIVCFSTINKELFVLPPNVKLYQLPSDPAFRKKDMLKLPWLLSRKLWGKRIWYRPMKKLMDEFKPTVVHCHFGNMGVNFSDFCRYEKIAIPFVTNFYGYDASELPLRDKEYAIGLARLWEDSRFVLAEGPAMGEKLVKLGAPVNKVKLSPIIVDGRKYPVKAWKGKQDPIKFLLIGRFVEKKGFHLFLEAIGKIKNEIAPFVVIMVGSGPMNETYQDLIQQYHLKDQVVFEGFRPLAECMQYMLEADVLVQTSITAQNGDSEGGAPTILIESQIMGLPIICSTHADIPFVMGYQDFMCREGDIADLSRVIKSFVSASNEHILEKINLGKQQVTEQHDMNSSSGYLDMLLSFRN